MFALVEGKITTTTIKSPTSDQDFKPHHLINVVQKYQNDSQMIKIKDYDLTKKYAEDASFKQMCTIREWAFNGKSGQTIAVI